MPLPTPTPISPGGFRVWGLGWLCSDLRFKILGFGFLRLGFVGQGLGFTVQRPGSKVEGLGFRVRNSDSEFGRKREKRSRSQSAVSGTSTGAK